MAREPEAVHVDDIDVAGARGVAFFQHARALVGERRRDARHDLLVGDRASRDAALLRYFIRHLIDQRIRCPVAAAGRVVFVPAGAGLLAVASHLEQAIRDLRLRPLGARLANRLEILPDARADVDAGDVLHPVRTDRQAEVGQHLVDLRHARAFLEQQVGLAHVIREHPVRDEAEAVADDDADLAELLRQLERRRDHFLAGVSAANDFEQLHDVRRAEVVMPQHLRRAGRSPRRIDRCRASTSSTPGCSRAGSLSRAPRTSPS